MQTALNYGNEERKGNIAIVREEKEKYVQGFNKKIELYMEHLKEIELKCADKNADKESIMREVATETDAMLEACASFEREIGDEHVIKAAQAEFCEKTNPIMSKSYGINRCRTWPQGYQGDYKTLEIAYKNATMSDGIGYYLDRYLLSLPLGHAVRERIVKLAELLREELKKRKNPRVLDIACGSCREIFDLIPEIKQSGARFTCVDLDSEALNFASNRISYTGLAPKQIEFVSYNALRLFDIEGAMTEFGARDLIYSTGYFDYLPDDFLVKLLRSLYMLLNPGGKLFAAFKDANRYRPQDYHWLVDWDGFLQRTENDFERILRQAGIPENAVSVTRDKTGLIIFYSITNKQLIQ